MDRMEQLVKIAGEYLTGKYFESAAAAENYYRMHKEEVIGQFTNAVREGFTECEAQGKKIKYIVFSVLESSILMKNYELQIAFYNEKIYLDDEPVYIYWVPLFLFVQIEDDIRAYRKKASKTVVRIREDEMEQIFRVYAANRYFDVYELLKSIVKDVVEQECQHYNCVTEDAAVLFGRYMEKSVLLYQRGGKVG